MRLTTSRRVRILKAEVFAKALYGVEATPLPENSRAKLQAAVLDAAGGFRGRARSSALGFLRDRPPRPGRQGRDHLEKDEVPREADAQEGGHGGRWRAECPRQ